MTKIRLSRRYPRMTLEMVMKRPIIVAMLDGMKRGRAGQISTTTTRRTVPQRFAHGRRINTGGSS